MIAEPLPTYLAEPSKLGQEISITGKWVPTKKGGLFRKSAESKEMLKEWEDIHLGAKADPGVLSTEINHAVGEDAVLVHHVFKDSDALIHYFSTLLIRLFTIAFIKCSVHTYIFKFYLLFFFYITTFVFLCACYLLNTLKHSSTHSTYKALKVFYLFVYVTRNTVD